MSPIKESSSPSAKESAPTATISRRSKTMPTDSPTGKFLYTILKQLDLKGVDWTIIATELEISNGHAARMRYHRFRNQMEGINPQQRKKQTNRVSKTSTNPLKAGLKKVASPDTSPVIKAEPCSDSPYETSSTPYVKTEQPYIKPEHPYNQPPSHLSDIPQYALSPQMVSAPYSHPSIFTSMPSPYAHHQMNLAPELRVYPSMPAYPPVPSYETGHRPPVPWTPEKAEPRALSEEHREAQVVEAAVKEEVLDESMRDT